jgi:uncharacterized protein with PQ loop repeat
MSERMAMDPQTVEIFMSIIAVLTNVHWVPQLTRLVQRKQSDDFSLWTTLILLTNNIIWFAYAGYIGSISLSIQQGLTLIMLLVFGSLIIKYRTTNLLFSDEVLQRWRFKYVRI